MSITAASSPTRGPTTTRWSSGAYLPSSAWRCSAGSLPTGSGAVTAPSIGGASGPVKEPGAPPPSPRKRHATALLGAAEGEPSSPHCIAWRSRRRAELPVEYDAAAVPVSILECVPNVSEGQDRRVVDRIGDAIRRVSGVRLAD